MDNFIAYYKQYWVCNTITFRENSMYYSTKTAWLFFVYFRPFLGIEFWVDAEWESSPDEIQIRKRINWIVTNPCDAAWLLAAALDELEQLT